MKFRLKYDLYGLSLSTGRVEPGGEFEVSDPDAINQWLHDSRVVPVDPKAAAAFIADHGAK